eukprot:TRINITY_DN21930_c0_g1_i1.p1 TRINITY_DN21930_c0_g1~~TRINITY_DN21930_c0_g1_i1.p1  ORF type:complete len:204 (+),score=35.53 TRINITY_DN21930_c0_g1_i1:184-795(+)
MAPSQPRSIAEWRSSARADASREASRKTTLEGRKKMLAAQAEQRRAPQRLLPRRSAERSYRQPDGSFGPRCTAALPEKYKTALCVQPELPPRHDEDPGRAEAEADGKNEFEEIAACTELEVACGPAICCSACWHQGIMACIKEQKQQLDEDVEASICRVLLCTCDRLLADKLTRAQHLRDAIVRARAESVPCRRTFKGRQAAR